MPPVLIFYIPIPFQLRKITCIRLMAFSHKQTKLYNTWFLGGEGNGRIRTICEKVADFRSLMPVL